MGFFHHDRLLDPGLICKKLMLVSHLFCKNGISMRAPPQYSGARNRSNQHPIKGISSKPFD
ncbi:protein of unknown function [Aminobacter niigataensis]|nr:protein of unknown function [Aminobacter niigataensis]